MSDPRELNPPAKGQFLHMRDWIAKLTEGTGARATAPQCARPICSLHASLETGQLVRIPKGFRPKAQGCEGRATLGNGPEARANPERVVAGFHPERGEAATLSGSELRPRSRVARSSQP